MGFVCRVLLLCVIMTVLLGQVTMQAKGMNMFCCFFCIILLDLFQFKHYFISMTQKAHRTYKRILEGVDVGVCEPRCVKTGLRGFQLGPTQTRLYSQRRWLEA